jgi:hypothetical protein
MKTSQESLSHTILLLQIKKLPNIFKKHKIMLVYINKGKISDILGNPKDKSEQLEKSGIYEIMSNGCNAVYISRTRRGVSVRFSVNTSVISDITIQIFQMSLVMSSNISEILIVNTKSASTTCLLSNKYENLTNWTCMWGYLHHAT